MRQVDIQARSVDEAVRLALEQLGRTRDQVKVEVLATDPGSEEVLVRVISQDNGPSTRTEAAPRGRREPSADREERPEPGNRADQMERPPRANRFGGRPPQSARTERPFARARDAGNVAPMTEPLADVDLDDDDLGNRLETSVLVDSSLQTLPLAVGEHATPQDAIAPVAAEILQKILMGMKFRGRIVRREAQEEGDAAFPDDQDSLVLNVVGLNEREQTALIGRRGETLDALQFLVNLIVGRQVDLWARVVIDVENYRLRRKLALMNLARRTAEQVQARNQAIPLEVMPAYERRIVHMTLQEHPAVTTESSGAEPERRVVILPK